VRMLAPCLMVRLRVRRRAPRTASLRRWTTSCARERSGSQPAWSRSALSGSPGAPDAVCPALFDVLCAAHAGRTLTAWRHCRAQTAQSLDAVAVKVDKESSKNEREIDTIIAAMLKGKGEREAMSRAHLAECAALNENLQGLLDKVMEKRRSSMPALSDSVEQRVAEVRTAVLAEVEALKSRPGAAAPHLLPGLLLCMAGGQASESDQRHLACHGEQAACQA